MTQSRHSIVSSLRVTEHPDRHLRPVALMTLKINECIFKCVRRNSSMPKLGTVVIGGGSGFIGNAISRTLEDNGYKVITISRKPGPYRMTWSELLSDGLPQCVAVINVAGQNVLDPKRRWTKGFKQNVWSSRVNTTRSLAKVIYHATEPPKVFATISGVGFYKPSPDEEYTEDSPGGDSDFLPELCKDWESASSLPDGFPIRRVIIRSGVVLGRKGGLISQLIWPFFLGLGGPVGSGQQYMPWIHIEDLAELFRYSVENDHVSGVLNGVAPQIITNGEFAKTFARQMWRPALIPLPLFAINFAFGEERAKLMTEGQKVIPKRTLESGFRYTYPDIKSACKQCAQLIYADDME